MEEVKKDEAPKDTGQNVQEVVVAPAEIKETEIGTVTVTEISKTGPAPKRHPNLVKFLVEYPKDHDGSKPFPAGSTQNVSKESAEIFVTKKYGRIIK